MRGRKAYGLSFREFEILNVVASGRSDREIAIILGISHFTVQKHVANILRKMRATCRTEASIRAVRKGLID